MSWTGPAELRAQVQKLWNRGELLSGFVTDQSIFPRRMLLKTPTSAEMTDRFAEVRRWVSELRGLSRYRLEMREFSHRVLGQNVIPHEIWLDTVEDALAIVGKQRDATRFRTLVDDTRSQQPRLLGWLAKRPLRALELLEEWSRLCAIVAWLEKHPRPAIYLRQVDIPGVHSKFIEAHRGVLTELLDIILPPEAINFSASGAALFARRYGFCNKPLRIRFRILDPAHAFLPWSSALDITLDAPSFARLDPSLTHVFITENEINFLAFPEVKDSMVLFGSGYGFEVLREVEWLSHCRIHYWGDIDTHGFAILDQLRSQFTHVESFLMDRRTLLACENQWGVEDTPTQRDLNRLTKEEKELYDDLRDNRLRSNLRLEQERIGFTLVEAALSVCACQPSPSMLALQNF
jgi:hypothetical protein